MFSPVPGMSHWNLKFSKRYHLKVLFISVMWFIPVTGTLAWWLAVSTWLCPSVRNPGVTKTFVEWPGPHLQFWVAAVLWVSLLIPGLLWGPVYQVFFFFSEPLLFQQPHFLCRLPFLIFRPSCLSCSQQVAELWSDTSKGSSKPQRVMPLLSCFPSIVWCLCSPHSSSDSLCALGLSTGQPFKGAFIMFKSFSLQQIFAYGNPTFAIWFFLFPSQRNSQFHIYFEKWSFPQMVSPKNQSKVRVYAFLQRFWAEVRITHVFSVPSAVISSVHLIMGHDLPFFFFFFFL